MSELTERLRWWANSEFVAAPELLPKHLGSLAADRIEQLEAGLRDLLDGIESHEDMEPYQADLDDARRRARALLGEKR